MQARVVTVQAEAGKIDEMVKIYRDSVVPAGKKQKGFKGALLLTGPDGSKGMSVTFWESEADMVAGEKGPYYQEQIAKLAGLMTGTPVVEHYTVGVQV
jgi:heme-degrading monooxygenase HmoA